MKKFYTKIVVALVLILIAAVALSACDTTSSTYSVTFIADGKEVKTVATGGGEKIELPEAPEKEGYEFKGWYLDRWLWQDEFDGNNFVGEKLTHDVKVYAYYLKIEYKNITFYADGKVVKVMQSTGFETLPLPAAPEKEDYEFEGWYLDEGVWSQPFTEDYFEDKEIEGDFSVFAKYKYVGQVDPEPQEYAIKFYADGKLVDTLMSAGNEILTLPTAPVKDDYDFKGWYFDNGVWEKPFTAEYFADKAVTEDVSVYAKYDEKPPVKPTEYAIRFYADGKPVGTIMSAGNEILTLPTAPVKDDYDFKGWYLDNGVWEKPFTAEYFADKAVTEDVSVYAKYDEKPPVAPTEYAIKFYADGKPIDTIMSAGNEILTLPAAPTKQHYDFKGWYLDEGSWREPFTAEYYADKATTKDVNVYAYYERVKYDIVFYDGGAIVGTVKSAGNEILTLPDAPVKENYEFRGWYLDEGIWSQPFTAEYFADKATTGKISVYAYYEYVPTFTVSFDTDGGTELDPVKVSVIETEPFTEKSGYDFEGWYLDAEKTDRVLFPFNVQHDCTLYAKWTEKTVTFTLDSNNYISGISGKPANGVLNIPATVNGVKVKGISDRAFIWNTDIVSVTIDPSITYIGFNAFKGCSKLESINIPYGVTRLYEGVFSYCSSLKHVDLPDTLKYVDRDVFSDSGITSITLPASVESIGQYAFKNCKSLASVDLGQVEILEQGLFQNCSSLTSIEFPDTLRKMDGNYMFMGCYKLAEVIYPDVDVPLNYNFVHNTMYYNNAENWVDDALYVGNHLVTVNREFRNKTSFSVREGTVTIARLAFYENSSQAKLASLTLPEGLKYIGERAFEDCTLLSSVNIPDSVIKIGADAFDNTLMLKSGQVNYIGNWLINYSLPSGESVIEVKEGTIGIADGELTEDQGKVTEVRLPSTLKYIGTENFKNMQVLTTVNIPASLVVIGNNAFQYCYILDNVDLKQCAELKTIGNAAFNWCKVLSSLYIPRSVENIGESAFNQAKVLTLYIEREQDEIPSGWDENWNYTYAENPLNIVWGASK